MGQHGRCVVPIGVDESADIRYWSYWYGYMASKLMCSLTPADAYSNVKMRNFIRAATTPKPPNQLLSRNEGHSIQIGRNLIQRYSLQ